MRSLIKVSFIFFVLFLLSITSTVQASDELSVQCSLTETTMTEMGTDVTLEMTIANTGDSALSNISIIMIKPLKSVNPHDQSLSISILSAGESTSSFWSISTIMPAPYEKIAADLRTPIILDISAVNENGEAVRPMTIVHPMTIIEPPVQ